MSNGATIVEAGAVNLFYGSDSGLSASGNQFWHQNVPDVLGVAEDYDHFGFALTAGYFNGDAYADLAVGVPFEGLEVPTNLQGAGAVNVLYGSGNGLAAADSQFWHQGSAGIADSPEASDLFGITLVPLYRPPTLIFLPFIRN